MKLITITAVVLADDNAKNDDVAAAVFAGAEGSLEAFSMMNNIETLDILEAEAVGDIPAEDGA